MGFSGEMIAAGTLPRTRINSAFEAQLAAMETAAGDFIAPSSSLDLSNLKGVSKITMAGNLTTTLLNVPTGGTILRFIHGGDSLSVTYGSITITEFINKSGSYYLWIFNSETPGAANVVMKDVFSLSSSEIDALISGANIEAKLDARYGGDSWRTGGSGSVTPTQYLVITSSEIASLNTTPKVLKTSPGTTKRDIPIEAIAVFKGYGIAYGTYTVLELLSGSTVIGTCDILGNTGDQVLKFTLSGTPEKDGALSVRVQTDDPTGSGNGEVGVIAWYTTMDESSFAFTPWEVGVLGTTAEYGSGGSSTTIRPRGKAVSPKADCWIYSITIRHNTASGNLQVGVYSDSSLNPNSLLASSSSESGVTSGMGWTTHYLTTPLFVAKGTRVHLGWVYELSTTTYYGSFGNTALQTTSAYPLPSTFGTPASPTLDYSAYANVLYDASTYNYVVDDSFTTWTLSTIPDGWEYNVTPNANNYVEENANGLHFVSTVALTNFGIKKAGVLTIGQRYYVEIEMYSVTTAGVSVYTDIEHSRGDVPLKIMTSFVAGSVDFKLLRPGAVCEGVVRSIKVWQ